MSVLTDIFKRYDLSDKYPKTRDLTLNPQVITDRSQTGLLYNVPTDQINKSEDQDSKLQVVQELQKTNSPFSNLFNKPILDKEWIEYYQKKLEIQNDIEFENWIIETFGNGEQNLKLLNETVPEVITKRQIPVESKLDIHNKLAKIAIRGPESKDDYILTYLISSGKLGYDPILLNHLLSLQDNNQGYGLAFNDDNIDQSRSQFANSHDMKPTMPERRRPWYANVNKTIDQFYNIDGTINDMNPYIRRRNTGFFTSDDNQFGINFGGRRNDLSRNYFSNLLK